MLQPDQISSIKDLVANVQSIMVVFPAKSKLDLVSAALSLAQSMRQAEKEVQVLCAEVVDPVALGLIGDEVILSQMGNQNLQVSFEYSEEKVDKVSYHIDEETRLFHLVVQPKKGVKPLDPKDVKYSYVGAETDLIFSLGVSQLQDLGKLYEGFEVMYDDAPVISIHEFQADFGSVKVDTSGMSSYSELMAKFIYGMGYPMSGEVATNLLAGIEDATDTFRLLATSAETLEVAAGLLRAGAERRPSRRATPLTAETTVTLKQTPETPQLKKLNNNGLAQAFSSVSKNSQKSTQLSEEKQTRNSNQQGNRGNLGAKNSSLNPPIPSERMR